MRGPRVAALIFAGAVNAIGIAVVLAYALSSGYPRLGQGKVSGQVVDLLWFSALSGVAAFATIEILKRVLGLRGYYQRHETREWLTDRTPDRKAFDELLAAMGLTASGTGNDVSQDPEATEYSYSSKVSGLLELSEEFRVFNLPTEQLAAQISSAADVAVASKGKSHVLFLSGLTGIPPTAVQGILAGEPPDMAPPSLRTVMEGGAYGLSQRVRAGVDQLQISLSERWRRFIQGAALWLAGVYGILLAPDESPADTSESLYVICALIIGGLLAWTLRDITAAIERARR